MIAMLGFVLECAATAALVGAGLGLVVFACLRVLREPLHRLGPALRGDLYLLGGLLPALAAICALLAAAAPSVGSALGFGPDHCPGHEHHFHICFRHFSGLRPALAALGALALMSWVYGAGGLLRRLVLNWAESRQLEGLGEVQQQGFPVVLVPGTRLCHATGLLRRRILLSEDVRRALSSEEVAAALAHEESHLRRRDPLADFMLAGAGLFVPPPFGRWMRRQHRLASEEACDGAAATAVGDGLRVADALVKVAALQCAHPGDGLGGMAFGEHELETRVGLLLADRDPCSAKSRWRLAAGSAAVGFALVLVTNAQTIHHAAETILGHIF